MMKETTAQFGRIPFDVVADGHIARLTGNKAKVYVILTAHRNQKSGVAKPGIERIARVAGANERTVCRAIKQLSERGLISFQSGGVWSWLRRLMAKKQAERPLPVPAYYADGWAHASVPADPASEHFTALLQEISA